MKILYPLLLSFCSHSSSCPTSTTGTRIGIGIGGYWVSGVSYFLHVLPKTSLD